MELIMSQPKPYTRAPYSNTTTSSPLSSPGTVSTAFLGDGDSGGNSNSNKTYTYNRKRGTLRSEHQHMPHEHSRNAPGPSQAAIPVGMNNINQNNQYNFHYHQKGRQQSVVAKWSAAEGSISGETHHDRAEDIIDDDIDGDGDENEHSELYGTNDNISDDGGVTTFGARRQYQQQFEVMQSKGAFDSDYLYGNDTKRHANHIEDSGLDQGRPHGQSQSRIQPSRVNDSNWKKNNKLLNDSSSGGINSGFGTNNHAASYQIPPTSKFARASTYTSAGNTSYTHPNQDNQAYNSRHTRYQQQQQQQHHHHPSASVSAVDYSSHSRRYNPPRQRQRPQQPAPSHPRPHTRAASSLAFYNTNTAKAYPPTSPPLSSLTKRASKASPPTAPPRVSSLLPPPRNTVAGTNTSPQPSLSTGPSTSANASTIAVTAAPILSEELASPGSDSHPNTNFRPLPASTATATATPPSSNPNPNPNPNVHEAPTHAQFALSFIDSLNTAVGAIPDRPDALSVLASGAGSGSGSAPDPGSASPVRARSDSGSGSRLPSHSRANSFGTTGDSLRNLNCWSSSTASSRLSTWDYHYYQQQQARQQKITSTRRMSVDSIGLVSQRPNTNQEPLPSNYASPRKLSKRRPSQGTSASPTTRPRARAGSGSALGPVAGGGATAISRRDSSPPPLPPSSSVPPPNLPPIISLPPLDTDPESSFRLGSPRAMGRASPGLNTPNSVFASQHSNAEPQDYFWSDLSNPARTASPAMRSNTTLLPPVSVTRDRDVVTERRGHSRSRSAARGGSGDSTKPKDRSSSKPSQKAMLSKALSMANTAVQLDNAQNFVAAREAYVEACELLQQVLSRTNGEDDRNKLEAIRRTYTSRIEELDALVPTNPHGDKALPARPDSFDYHGVQMELVRINNQSDAATITRSHRDGSPISQVSSQAMRRPSDITTYSDFSRSADVNPGRRQSSFSRSPMRRNFEGGALTIPHQSDDNFLPAPLSPRRPISPTRVPSPEPIVRQDFSLTSQRERLAVATEFRSHRRNLSHESASWLDPIDESGGSTASSVHSRSSSRIMRKHIRQTSGNTEAEFDAALDAAVEAAYDDGYEPMEPSAVTYDEIDEDRIATSMRKVELAKELVRQTEREAAIELARERERQRQMSLGQQSQTYGVDFFDANDSDEEEERMLEEMTRGYVMEDFALNQQSRYQSSVPRESNSSGFTSRTWHSSMGSNPPTGTTTISAVSEKTSSGNLRKASSPPMPPPTHSLPQPPLSRPSSTTGVRNRRLSGQNTKQLKIETSKPGPPPMPPPPINTSLAAQSQVTSSYIAQQRQALSAVSTRAGPFSMRAPSSPVRGISPADAAGPASPPGGQDDQVRTDSPSSTRPGMRKNFSTSSLKSLKSRQISVSHLDDADPLPMTPISQQMSNSSISRLPTMPVLPTPIVTSFPDKIGGGIGGLHLFDSDFHSPVAQSPNSAYHHHQQNPDIPMPLEPCPSDSTFRPFWLMRALYQTLAHPRGGYISNRLFVPQDAWKVKGVKLRNIEDKISQCDLLTAALQKLARVDSTDADAMLDEMQSFENILETVQATLSRRLGTEVGTQGMITFKEEKESDVPPVPRNNSISGKGGAFSWRRLRSKGSAVNLASTYVIKTNTNGAGIPERDVFSPGGSMPSLPMAAHPSSRSARRDVMSVKFDGPNAPYMASLARLFDAAQTVDQIARQVDDPGLRHADKTQVGLELCTRHAAEFFGLFICRFVLTDLGMLLDKFVKRGSEWVLN